MPTVTIPDVEVVLEHIACCECGLNFAVDDRWTAGRRRDHAFWYCPNGHRQHWGGLTKAEQDADRLRKLLESEQSYARDLHFRLESERKQHSATKGQLTRQKKRAAAALCPCCNRSFKQLRQHLTRMHPDFVEQGAVEHRGSPDADGS
jgi:hypothetical protein